MRLLIGAIFVWMIVGIYLGMGLDFRTAGISLGCGVGLITSTLLLWNYRAGWRP
jgi:hypothetical protein